MSKIGQFAGLRIKLKGKKNTADIFHFLPIAPVVVPKGTTLEIHVRTINDVKTVVYIGDVE